MQAREVLSDGCLILEARGLTRRFGGFVAVDKVDLRVREGSVHALIGPNGAGKTTCFNLLTKFIEPSSGVILFRGHDITRERPAQVARRGLIRSFQISAVFPQLTVLENVRIALQRKARWVHQFWRSERLLRSLDDRVAQLLSEVGLDGQQDRAAGDLPYGSKRALEIATTLATEPDLMLLDEPTQGMGAEDVDRVVELIRRVAHGRTVLMVEHNMSVVSNLADAITVLQHGRVLSEGSYDEVSRDPLVLEAYMGAQVALNGVLDGAHA